MYYRISKTPCRDAKTGFFYYRRTPVDPISRKAAGKPERLSLSTRNLKEARLRLKSISDELLDLGEKNEGRILWSDFRRQFEAAEATRVCDGELSAKSCKENISYLAKFESFIAQKFHTSQIYLSQVKTSDAREFLNSIKGKSDGQPGTRTRQRARNMMIQAFAFAVEDGKVEINPFLNTKKVVVKRKKPNPFTVEEVYQLVSDLPRHTYENRTWVNGIRFTYSTGLRRSELLNLRLCHLIADAHGSTIYLPVTKNEFEHWVPIEAEAKAALDDQLDNLRSRFGRTLPIDLPVFANSDGKVLSPSTVSKWVTKLVRRYAPHLAGKTFHCLRKTTATEVNGRDGIQAASEIVNHSSTAVTRQYYVPREPVNLQKARESLRKLPLLGLPRQVCESSGSKEKKLKQ